MIEVGEGGVDIASVNEAPPRFSIDGFADSNSNVQLQILSRLPDFRSKCGAEERGILVNTISSGDNDAKFDGATWHCTPTMLRLARDRIFHARKRMGGNSWVRPYYYAMILPHYFSI